MRRLVTAHRSRAGFTLFEVLLASAIALLLMAALYSAVNTALRGVQISREIVQQDTLVRAIVNRITLDLRSCLAPIAAQSLEETSSDAEDEEDATQMVEGLFPEVTPFEAGVIGDASQLTLFLSRVPADAVATVTGDEEVETASPSDLRRVSYWLGTAGDGGLARQEEVWLTATELSNSLEPDYSREAESILASEVTDLYFEYFDGTSWVTSWDGSLPGPDGVTAQGPPLAIAVELTITLPDDAGEKTTSVRHVIAIPASAGTAGAATDGLGAGVAP